MAAVLDASILESSVDEIENAANTDGKFKLKEFMMAEDKLSIVQDPTLNLIKATFWRNIYGTFPKSQIDGLDIDFDIKKIGVIFNKDFQDPYDVLKTEMNANELVVFQGMCLIFSPFFIRIMYYLSTNFQVLKPIIVPEILLKIIQSWSESDTLLESFAIRIQ